METVMLELSSRDISVLEAMKAHFNASPEICYGTFEPWTLDDVIKHCFVLGMNESVSRFGIRCKVVN